MSSQTIAIELPNDILLALNENESELKQRIKLTLAIELYKNEKLTIGKASQLCGLNRLDFEKELSKSKVPISNLNEDDIFSDIEKLK